MQNVAQHHTRQWKHETTKMAEKDGIELLYCPEIVGRDGRYVAFDNRVVCDCFSRLEWLPGPDKDMSWKEGCQWIKGLSIGGGGWRLPTLSELQGLFKMNKNGDNLSPLFKMKMMDVWSCESLDDSAWGFNFLPGNRFRSFKTLSRGFRILAVRPRKYYAFEKRVSSSVSNTPPNVDSDIASQSMCA